MKLGDVKEMNFEPLPQTWYHFGVVKAEYGVSSKKRTPYMKLSCLVLDGEHKGRYVFHDFWLTKKSLPFNKGLLYAMGYTDDDDIPVNEEGYVLMDESWFINKQFMGLIGAYEKYIGKDGLEKTKEKMSSATSLKEGGKEPMDLDNDDPDLPF